MREIRPIIEAESEDYLSLLCSAFDLDPVRARTAFFSEPYYDLSRKWAMVSDHRIVSILTVVPVEFGDGKGIGIAGVATAHSDQHSGHATELLNQVIDHYAQEGAGRALLFARAETLYLKTGFRQLDRVYQQPLAPGRPSKPKSLEQSEVQQKYAEWAKQDHRRLRRDAARWRYWAWTFKTPLALDDGYFCYESTRIRELLPTYSSLPLSEHMDFYGTGELMRDLGVPLANPSSDLLLMGKGFDYVPRMFMTDQF